MQYVITEIGNQKRLIAAREYFAWREGAIAHGEPYDETVLPFHIAYGAFMPQPELSDEQAVESMQKYLGAWHATLIEQTLELVALHEVEALPMIRSMGRKIPFAALIQAPEAIIGKISNLDTTESTPVFTHFHEMSAINNIFNRSGIWAMKGIERRRGVIEKETWRAAVDRERVQRTAKSIK